MKPKLLDLDTLLDLEARWTVVDGPKVLATFADEGQARAWARGLGGLRVLKTLVVIAP